MAWRIDSCLDFFCCLTFFFDFWMSFHLDTRTWKFGVICKSALSVTPSLFFSLSSWNVTSNKEGSCRYFRYCSFTPRKPKHGSLSHGHLMLCLSEGRVAGRLLNESIETGLHAKPERWEGLCWWSKAKHTQLIVEIEEHNRPDHKQVW